MPTTPKPKTLLQLLFNSPKELLQQLNLSTEELKGQTIERITAKFEPLHQTILNALDIPPNDECYRDIEEALKIGLTHLAHITAFDQTKEALAVSQSYIQLLYLIIAPYFDEERQRLIAEDWQTYPSQIQVILEQTAEELESQKFDYVIRRTLFGISQEEHPVLEEPFDSEGDVDVDVVEESE